MSKVADLEWKCNKLEQDLFESHEMKISSEKKYLDKICNLKSVSENTMNDFDIMKSEVCTFVAL